MRKTLLTLCFLLGNLSGAVAQHAVLRFNARGTLRIVQFTDVHYKVGVPESEAAITNINTVLDAEQPDLVVFTGDVIFNKPAEEGLRTVLDQVARRNIPFALTFGNHDDEQGLSRAELLKIIQSYPNNLTGTTAGLTGVTNYVLPVQRNASDSTAALLYIIDSNSYPRIEGEKGYDFIHADQVQWYRTMSQSFTVQNGGRPLPSVAFFHIPVPEFRQAVSDEGTKLIGTRCEKVCAPALNTGLFASIKECGDVMGIFVGHDHDNDYALLWHDVLLAYGRYTGGNTVYNNVKPNGARVIELREGERTLHSWIRLSDGSVTNHVYYPWKKD